METLYDLLLIKTKGNNKNIRILFIDEEYNKEFIELFKIKSCLDYAFKKNGISKINLVNIFLLLLNS